MHQNAGPEMVALVDRSGAVTGAAPRAEVRRTNLLHAATAVLVRDGRGRIYLHRRSSDKDWAPAHHDCAAGGVMQPGESPESAAARELAEELGIVGAELRPLGLSVYEDDTTRCVEHCFETVWDGPVVHVDDEVVWGSWVTLPELAERLADPSFAFVPDTLQLLVRLARDGVGDYRLLRSAAG
jgi:8-oxo-dGTP pyrophosphatase MutT (NUDIX family)